ncbi:thioredoxin family protein [Edwardsiella piscicida]|nr:thioredoxin family protein [Edwardsiella piscicida]ELM3729831.1 thioredoxin family protein [Edwardsiella piscicida]ELV7536104.1 thioredoxin family protein [Edwardsiella piscicida]
MKTLSTLLFIPAMLLSAAIQAASVEPYSDAAFTQAQASGAPVLVDVYADWCPVCKRQERELTPLFAQPAQRDLRVFKVNFDTQKAALQQFRVSQQSTLILYRNGQEVRRSIGETSQSALSDFLTR